ncbi:MAG: MFS transporter [Kofleriaceae bacterium]
MLSRRSAWFVVVIGTLIQAVSYIDRSTFAVLAPTISKELHISETAYGFLAPAFSLAYLFGTPIAGWWIDRIGARRGLVGSILAWSSVAAMHALVPNFAVLFVMRLALGFTEGPGFPGATQTIYRVLDPKERARGFGLLFTGSSIGGMIAPPLASHLYGWFGWRMAFVGTALVGLIWIPLWIGATSSRDARAKLDVPHEPAKPRPSFLELIKYPQVQRGVIAVLALSGVTAFVTLWGAKYLVRTFGIDQKSVGDYIWLPAVTLDAGALLFGDLAARAPKRIKLWFVIGLALALALAFLPLVETPWQSMGVIGVAMAGAGALSVLVTTQVLTTMPGNVAAFAGGTLAMGQPLATVILGPVLGPVIDHFQSYSQVAVGIACWLIPGSVIWLLWKRQSFEHQV